MVDNLRILQQQLAADVETTNGTAVTLTNADVALKPFQDNFTYTPDYDRIENNQVSDTLGRSPDCVVGLKAGISFGTLLTTSGSLAAASPPAIQRYLKGCGMKYQHVEAITIGAISGGDSAFAAGETYSDGGSKTGIVERDCAGSATLYYIATAGGSLAASDVVTVAGDGDSGTTSGSNADYAHRFTPRSTSMDTLTVERLTKNDQGTSAKDYIYRLAGAMGNAVMTFNALDAARIACEFTGKESFTGNGSFYTSVTYEDQACADIVKLVNATIQINGVSVHPASIEFNSGNEVVMDSNPTTDGGTTGYDFARIRVRAPTITIDPLRHADTTSLDDLALAAVGTEVSFSLVCGSSPDLVEIAVTRAQISETSLGERSGLETNSLTLQILEHATVDDQDYAIYLR